MASTKNNITIVLPTKNEGFSIARTIYTIQKYCDCPILVVDGYSFDQTVPVAKKFKNVEVIFDDLDSKGKGAALRKAFYHCYPDDVIFVDVDGTYELEKIGEFVRALEDGYDVVVSEKHYLNGSQPEFLGVGLYDIGDVLWQIMFGIFYGKPTANNLSGFRGLSRRAIELMRLEQDGWGIETEIEAKSIKLRLTEKIIDVNYDKRIGESKANFSLFSKDNYELWKSFFKYIFWRQT